MKRNTLITIGVGALATAAGFVGTFSIASATVSHGHDSAPPRPPWVDKRGMFDPSKAPKTIGVVDANGNVVKDENGKPVRIPFPTPPADQATNRTAPADPDAPDVMVPYAQQVGR